MTAIKSLVVQNGTTKQIPDADSLLVGTGIDRSTAGDLTIGGTTATSITLGSASIPVNIPGDVTTVGGTTFTTDATFEGNVTFGNANTDTVDFVAKVDSDIEFAAPGYKITNLLDPTSAQDAATQNYVDTEISGAVNVGSTFVAVGDGTGIVGSSALTFDSANATLTVTGDANPALVVSSAIDGPFLQVSPVTRELAITDPLTPTNATAISPTDVSVGDGAQSGNVSAGRVGVADVGTTNALSLTIPAGVATIKSADGTATAQTLLLDASQIDVNSVKIINVADGVDPTDAVNKSQLDAIVAGVSDVTATAPLLSSGGATPDISIDTAGASNGDVLKFSAGAWAPAALPPINVGETFVAVGAGAPNGGLYGDNKLTFNAAGELGVSSTDPIIAVSRSDVGNAMLILRPESAEFMVAASIAAFATLKASDAVSPIPLKLDASEFDVDSVKIVNVADGVDPTDAVNKSQLDALVVGVSAVSATAPLLSSGGATPDISIDTAGAANGDVLTFNAGAWAAAAPVLTPPGGAVDNVQLNDGAGGFAGSASLSFAASTLTVQSTVAVTDGSETLSLSKDSASTDAATLDIEAASSVTATITGGATYLLTPSSIDALTYAASVALDLAPSLPALKSVTLTGDITFTTSNVGAARNISVRVIGDASSRNLVFPAGWTWLGGAAPTVLEANKVAILSIAAFGATDSTIVASWSYDGSDVVTDVTASGPLASSGGATPDISFPSWPANASGALTNDGAGNLSWAPDAGGTVTSVDLSTTLSGITVGGNPITTSGTLTLSGTLGVSSGGTGATSLTSGSLLAGNGTGAVAEIAPGTNNQVLTVVGGAWAAASLPAATDYSVVAITTAQAANTAVTVAGAAAQADVAANARVAGIVKAANSVQVLGIVTCIIESSITIAQGDVVYLSASEAGKVTKDAPGAGVIAELGIATASGSGAGGTVAVLWQPKSITVL
jgi:hypothetical protein